MPELDTDIIVKKDRRNKKIWLHGLMSAFIGGSATAIYTGGAAMIFKHGWQETIETTLGAWLIAGLVSAAAYLKQSPVPKLEELNEDENTTPISNPIK